MNDLIERIKVARHFVLILASVLLLSFHIYFVYFINSTYLNGILGESIVGYTYALGAILNLCLFLIAPKILRARGNYKLTMVLTAVEAVSLLSLAFTTNPVAIIFFFLIHQAVSPLLMYTMDIFLEKYAEVAEMGTIRGIYLTMNNLPAIITPFVTGMILADSSYWKVYLISVAFLIPFALIMATYFKGFRDQAYPLIDPIKTASHFFRNKQVRNIFFDHFLLHFFYSCMVIYMPIYLHEHIGFDWPEIGIMFSIMLLPFILFQIPVGKLEDVYHDEKEVLVAGFIIMAVTTMMIPLLSTASFFMWTGLLFMSRIGASLVEVSSESFFFKHVKSSNAGYISFYRLTRSLPFLVTPVVASITFLFFDFKFIFFILGLIMLLGVRYALKLRNTY